ncbi:DUF4123 domain-containing protein [Actinobacillus vicugnae]|uniref:DUF4123 domain-containing protein n=1 Tax=Actinobacillus vicugnae TaxID=2573093 RepID=UPI001240ED5E|nr:DUF4123 domain-containing protein [Actinobacillus vicugnae]
MSESKIWVSYYHYSPIGSANGVSTGYIVGIAENSEAYLKQVDEFCQENAIEGYMQLAPLPILTWFNRHGFSSGLVYWAKHLSEQNPIALLNEGDLANVPLAQDQEYLIQENINFEPFIDIFGNEALPSPLKNRFFSKFKGLDEWHKLVDLSEISQGEMHYYAVVDCAKVVGLSDRLEQAGKAANLYTGAIGESLENSAPYLIEFDPSHLACVELLQTLFRQMDSEVLSYWQANPAIFIRSTHDFDTVYRHLKKFTHLQDPETQKWYFFRFYDPQVLNRYLPKLTNHPAHLAALFGVRDGKQVIEAFGVRIEKRFITFELDRLAENIQPARIELGELERKIMEQISWERMKTKLIKTAENYFPEIAPNLFDIWLEEGKLRQVADSVQGYWMYLSGRVIAEANNWDYFALLEEAHQETGDTGLNLTESLMNDLIEKDKAS